MSYTLNQENFKKAAKNLHQSLGSKSGLAYNQILQELSQAFFKKPYEEIKETILSNKEKNIIQETPSEHGVLIVNYGSEYFLFLVKNKKINYVTQTCVGTDMEIQYDSIEMQANSLASIHNTTVLCFEVPNYLSEDYENDDLINFCEHLGLNNIKESLFFKLLWDNNSHVFLDGVIVDQNTLNWDWFEQLDLDYDNAIYTPESIDKFRQREFFIVLEEIMNAKFLSENSWIINYQGHDLLIEFK